jgi:putative membrane protein
MKTSTLLPYRFTALIAAAFLALSASAQPPLKHADHSFIKKASKCMLEDADISRVAVTRTMNPRVREFAQMLVDDHGRTTQALGTIAASKGVQLPAKDMEETDKWTKKSSKDFDEEYLEKMISHHKDAVKLFEKEADQGEDAVTKAFARETLPLLQHHLAAAQELKKTVK